MVLGVVLLPLALGAQSRTINGCAGVTGYHVNDSLVVKLDPRRPGAVCVAPIHAAPVPIPPTPTPVAGVCANEPAGFTRIQDQPWDTTPSRNVRTSAGWIDDSGAAGLRMSVIVDPTSPFPWTNHNVAQGLFPAGFGGGSAPFFAYRPFAAKEQYQNLYLCMFVKHDANFDNTNGNAGTKFVWPAGDQVQGVLTYTSFNAPNMDFQVIQQGAVDRQIAANLSSALVLNLRGTWVKYELLLKANTNNSTANGGLDVWINGVPTHHYTDVNWQMNTARTWLSLAWNPTYGGGTNPVPHNQYEYMDHLRVSGK